VISLFIDLFLCIQNVYAFLDSIQTIKWMGTGDSDNRVVTRYNKIAGSVK